MPQNKIGHRPAGRQSKVSPTAKVVASKPVKPITAAAPAKPAIKSRAVAPAKHLPKAKSAAKPAEVAAKTKAAPAVAARPIAIEKAPAIASKAAPKHVVKAPPAPEKLTKKRKAAKTNAPAVENNQPTAEPEFDFWRSTTVFTSAVEELSIAPPSTESIALDPVVLPPSSAFVPELAFAPIENLSAATKLEQAAVDAQTIDSATAGSETLESLVTVPEEEPRIIIDAEGNPIADRRRVNRSLFERRLKDPTAKERRQRSAASDNEQQPAASEESTTPAIEAKVSSTSVSATESGLEPLIEDRLVEERRVAERRETYDREAIQGDSSGAGQQPPFNDTAAWMRKSGTALIGLNILLVVAVLFLWHSHSASAPDKEMQSASTAQMAEMHRATNASEVAAYAACLGSQTARNMLMQMKAGSSTSRGVSMSAALQNPSIREQAAQIEFDLEKDTSVNVHMPVLFHVGFENIGKSQALNTRMWGAVKVVESGKEPDFKYGEISFSKEAISPSDPSAKLVLYSVDGTGMVTPVNDATYQRINSGDAYVVAYGKVQYQDIFGTRHWANFCREITQPTGSKKHNRCAAYNSTGAVEVAPQARTARDKAPLQQTASMTLPEIACVVPKDQKN